MSSPSETRQWILNKKPYGTPTTKGNDATFTLQTNKLPSLSDGQLLVKTLYLSNDPAQRGWISPAIAADRLYVPPVNEGDVMRARGLAEVVESSSSDVTKGAIVQANVGWAEHAVVNAKDVITIKPAQGTSLTHYLGAMGMTGMTAYYGLVEIARAGKDDVVVVSGAAGATGSMVVQIAKGMVGCKKVVGLAGSDDKCRWVEGMGADVCLNYKSASFEKDLARETPDYASVYFDNVGGGMLDLMLTRMARHGRIAACGAISNYNRDGDPEGLKNWFQVITQRLEIRGFIILDFLHKAGELTQKFTQAVKDGTIKLQDDMETVVDTKFDDVPHTWLQLFEGANQGKLITKLV